MPNIWRGAALGLAIWLTALGVACAADSGPARTGPSAPSQRILVLLRLPPEHFRPNADYSDSYGDGQGRSARRRIATGLAQKNGLTLVDDWPMPLVGVDCYIMTAPAGRSSAEVAALLSRDPRVAWAEPVNAYHGQGGAAAPKEPLLRAQPAAREWRLTDLHQIATGKGVVVAVVDSMIEKTHPDLIGQVPTSQDFVPDHPAVPERHGTGVAGIIAAKGVGILGVAPGARLMALRACWQEPPTPGSSGTSCDSLSLAKALHFAVAHNAQVINLSLSGPPDPLLGKLLDVAMARGITVVGAFDRSAGDGGFPASHHGVVAVADEALDAPPSGIYSAPGRDVPTTQPGGRWFLVDGSSYAAAHVSGLFALLRERAPHAHGSFALVTARSGGGAIDACATLLRAAGPCDCSCSRARGNPAIRRQ
jgi:subtilisin family serine protease